MRSIYLIFILIISMSTSLFAQTEDKNIFTEDKTGITVTADQPQFTIKLKSNPTTGYLWFLRDYDHNLLTPLKHVFEANTDKKLMGAPGYEIWVFKMKPTAFIVPQQTVIRLIYSRPWDGDDQSKQIAFRVSTISIPSADHSQKPM